MATYMFNFLKNKQQLSLPFFIHQDYFYISLGEFKRNYRAYFKNYGRPNRIDSNDIDLFIKPNNNEKTFHGEVLSLSKYNDWLKYLDCNDPTLDMLCLVSKPINIGWEWRLVVADKKVITGSQYRKIINGESSVEIEEGYP